jgi:hypothetical protein
MTIFDFAKAVNADELSDKAVKAKWDKLCDALKDHDVKSIKEMIKESALSGLIYIEGNDGFGTEGMSL